MNIVTSHCYIGGRHHHPGVQVKLLDPLRMLALEVWSRQGAIQIHVYLTIQLVTCEIVVRNTAMPASTFYMYCYIFELQWYVLLWCVCALVKHSGNLSFDAIMDIARTMRPRSMARSMAGTVKEILGESSAPVSLSVKLGLQLSFVLGLLRSAWYGMYPVFTPAL